MFSYFYITSRTVDVEINAATLRPVFVELGRCFSLFPNLHTVKIVTKFPQHSTDLEKAIAAAKRGFKRSTPYPQIRSVVLSPSGYPLLAACPNLESLATFPRKSEYLLKFTKWRTTLQNLTCSFLTANGWFVAISFEVGLNTPNSNWKRSFISSHNKNGGFRLSKNDMRRFPVFFLRIILVTANKTAYQSPLLIPKCQNLGPSFSGHLD